MSAYLCNPDHIGVLANAMSRAGVYVNGSKLTPKQMAVALANANYVSIQARYPDDVDFMTGGKSLIAYRAQCAEQACYPDHQLQPIDLISMAKCFIYQACEAHEFHTANYKSEHLGEYHMNQFIGLMIHKLPGYHDAPYHYQRKPDPYSGMDLSAVMMG